MQQFRIVPKISVLDSFKEFHEAFAIGENDLILTHGFLYEAFMKPLGCKAHVLFVEKFGTGEPNDEMIDAITHETRGLQFNRVVAIGGGSVVDISKLLALDLPDRIATLFEGVPAPAKSKELVIVPTTCGTGSEVTNLSVFEVKAQNLKRGFGLEQMYADYAVLIPETLKGLPHYVFATSSVDALIHAAESCLSPKANAYTRLYSLAAFRMLLEGYKIILNEGPQARGRLLENFAVASNYAGIAFGNAGVGAVHALSYSIGGAFHVPHGEANYQFFTQVFKCYKAKDPTGNITLIDEIIIQVLELSNDEDIYSALDTFLGRLIAKKPLKEYGMTTEQIESFTQSTIANQQRLLVNNYVPLDEDEIRKIFRALY
ncbi:4-hydroxybutyrate dehydrogenase [Oscillospiraceae bacterium MB08-C2-2]|nr:4-hydroxybutyrate dehydrogenase [Oscillospiraceae bacterium MB08-C2-2]